VESASEGEHSEATESAGAALAWTSTGSDFGGGQTRSLERLVDMESPKKRFKF
jgi:hypothetical protein